MKKIILLFVLTLVSFSSKGQSRSDAYISLPADPVYVSNTKNYWLKGSAENILNPKPSSDSEQSYESIYWTVLEEVSNKVAFTTLAKNEWACDRIFNWLRPALVERINRLNVSDKIDLYQTLRRAIHYLETVNEFAENQYLRSHQSSFGFQSPNDYFDRNYNQPFPGELLSADRETESFLFRRINDGVSKTLMLKYLRMIYGLVNVNFYQHVNMYSDHGVFKYDYTWNRDHYEGRYSVYKRIDNYLNSQYGLITSENYTLYGQKNGNCRYYTLEKGIRQLSNEVDYENGRPIGLTVYKSENYNDKDRIQKKCDITFRLKIPEKVLTAEVFVDGKYSFSLNSSEDHIDFWDLYETKSRIFYELATPGIINIDLANKSTLRESDKPAVLRSPRTGNYVLYDRLQRAGKDHALLFGTDIYDHKEALKNPVRDAEFIASDLHIGYGFDCEVAKNTTKNQFLSIIQRYQYKKFADDEQLLIFISGHGSYEPGDRDGFIVLKDGREELRDINHSTWLSYTEMLNQISKIPCNHILLMVDACYSGSLQLAANKMKSGDDDYVGRLTDTELWFRNRIRAKTRRYITSTASDKVASDGINHSPFTDRFIKALRQFGSDGSHIMTVTELYKVLEYNAIPIPVSDSFKDNDMKSSFFFVMR